MWGFHPTIIRRMIDAVILPILFYAAPVWCTAIIHPTVLTPLNRVLRRCAMAIMGLLRTTSTETALATAGLHHADVYIRRSLVEFYVRHLTYGHDVTVSTSGIRRLNRTHTPSEILRKEISALCHHQHLPESTFTRVERKRWWYSNPSDTHWEPEPSLLTREDALSRLHIERTSSPPDSLWVFTDGSVSDTSCGAAALFLHGRERHGHTFAVHFSGQHSSTHAEMVALRLACSQTSEFTHTKCVTFVSDSMPALQGICRRNGASDLAVTTRTALINLHNHVNSIRLWWIPAHVGLEAHDQVDSSAKHAADGSDHTPDILVPFSHTSLKGIIRRYYTCLENERWTVHSRDRHLLPRFDPSLSWTTSLPRKMVTLTAQFLSGHFVTNAYLHRFHLSDSERCIWCGHPVCDRSHILLDCPRFEYPRQQMFSDSCLPLSSLGTHVWDLLLVPNRSHLARFLSLVDKARRSVSD